MNPNVLTAAISAGAAVITAVVALVLNQRGFATIENRINDLSSRLIATDNRLSQEIRDLRNETNNRLDRIEIDLKEFFKIQADHERRIQRLEDQK